MARVTTHRNTDCSCPRTQLSEAVLRPGFLYRIHGGASSPSVVIRIRKTILISDSWIFQKRVGLTRFFYFYGIGL